MKFWRQKLEQLSRAMEFSNVHTRREFERLLESRETAAPSQPCKPAAPLEYRFCRMMDFSALAPRTPPKPVGQH